MLSFGPLKHEIENFDDTALLPIGTKVKHNYVDGHGDGTVIAYNESTTGAYNKYAYPYIVEFASGYKDCYAKKDLART